MAVKPLELQPTPPADEAGPPEVFSQETDMAPVVAIGGLCSDITPWRVYSPLLAGDHPEDEQSASERFMPILKGGRASFDEMYKHLEEGVQAAHERAGERLVVVSQSLGGLFSTELGVKHSDKIAAVICLAGAQAGMVGEKPAAKLLRHAVGNPANAADLQADSNLMLEHQEKIASEWSEDTSLHLISPSIDILIPIQQGLKVELPEGQQPEKRVVVPRLMPEGWARRLFGVPEDAGLIKNIFGVSDHFNIAVTPAVIAYVRNVRREVAGHTAETVEMLPSPSLEPLPAAA